MLRRRRDLDQTSDNELDQLRTLHEWVLSLPWVVERPYEPGGAHMSEVLRRSTPRRSDAGRCGWSPGCELTPTLNVASP